jgi:DHA1 family tetracycline resistance protein-like MFS transporter
MGRMISGLTASSVPTAQAYMSDVTPKEERAAAFGVLSAAFGVGLVVGPALGGVLGSINLRLPFLASGVLSLINGCYGIFVLPESLRPELRSPFSWRRANPIGSASLLLKSPQMIGLAAILLLGYFAQQSLMNVYVLYAYFRYGWTERAVGLSLGLLGCFTIVVGLFVVKRVTGRLGERRAIFIGLLGGAVGYLGFALAPTGRLFLCALPVLTLMGITWPSIQAIMTRYTSPSEQGQLQGAINSLRGISGLGGPEFFTAIFAVAVGRHAWIHLPGLPFFVASAILLVNVFVAYAVTKEQRVIA